MFQVVYNIGITLMVLTALAVFGCLVHAYFEEYKKTPHEKKAYKRFEYFAMFVLIVVSVTVGQYYIRDTEFADGLRQWANFLGQQNIELPSENTSLTDFIFDSEPKEYEKERQEIKP